MFNIRAKAGAVGAKAVSRNGFSSAQNAPQHC
jgi:hypothetical protein